MPYNERYIENTLCSKVKRLSGRAFKWVSPGCAGVPDRIVVLPGPRILFVELKRPGRKDGLSARQKKILAWLVRMGCEAYRVSSEAGIDEILGWGDGI